MANIFHDLPAPAANGPGAWTDCSDMGAIRSVTSVGNGSSFEPFVTVEISNDDSPTDGIPLETFFMPGESTFQVAAMWMRAVTQNYRGGGAPTVSVGSSSDTTSAVELVATAGNGTGAAVDTSTMPTFVTVAVTGTFRGQLNILISEDGGTTYSEAFSFNASSAQTAVFAADHMKAERVGVPDNSPGQPVIWVGATSPGGGGGGGGSITVDSDGTPVVDPATILNFSSAFTVTDAGGGQANIGAAGSTILGVQTFQVSVLPGDPSNLTIPIPSPLQGGDFFIMAQMINFTDLLACAIAGQPLDPSATTFVLALSGDCSVGDSWVFIYVNDV